MTRESGKLVCPDEFWHTGVMSDKKYLGSFLLSDPMNEALRLRRSIDQAVGSPAVLEQLRVQSRVFEQFDVLRRSGALAQL